MHLHVCYICTYMGAFISFVHIYHFYEVRQVLTEKSTYGRTQFSEFSENEHTQIKERVNCTLDGFGLFL